MIKFYNSLKIITCIFLLSFGVGSAYGQVFITEIADPVNNFADGRYLELYNAGASPVDFTEGNGWEIRLYFNANTSPGATIDLTGTIGAGETYIIAQDEVNFPSVYGFSANQGGNVNSNGDDNFELIDGTDAIVDVFGVVGEDGTGTDHEFEDGRAERNSSVTTGNATYTAAEWTIDSDVPTGDGELNAPEGYDPGSWIGSNINPVVYLAIDVTEASEATGTVITVTAFTQQNVTGAQTVDLAVTGTGIAGTDYNLSSTSITIADATNSGSVTLTVLDDSDIEDVETATITMSNPSAGLDLSPAVQRTFTITDNDGPDVVINEVQYLGADLVELKNISTATVDISGYYLCTLITYEALSSMTNVSGTDLSLDPGEIVVLSPNTITFDDVDADLGLYINNADFSLASNMESFVQWGAAGNGRESVADTKGIWTAGDFISTVAQSGNSVEFDGEGFSSSDWIEQYVPTFDAENSLIETFADISSARAQGLGADIRISGEVVISFQGNSADKIYVQDANAGLLIDDNGTINTVYNTGDGLINIEGTLVDGSGVMELAPLSDPGTANSSGNVITPLEVTMATFKGNIDTYESRVIKIVDVTFNDAGATFSNFSNFDFTDGVETLTFRPNFSDPDFSAVEVPYGQVDVIGIAGEFNGSAQVVPFSNTEFVEDVYAPIFVSAPTTSNVTTNSFDVTFQADEPGTYYYVVDQNATPPDAATVISTGTSLAYTDVAADVTFNVSGLTDNTQYYVHVVLADDETTPNEQAVATTTTATTLEIVFDADSDITDPVTQVAAGTVSSLANDAGSAVDVFTFTLSDLGTADGEPTLVNTIVIEKGANNTVTDWSTVIAGAEISGIDPATTITTINSDNITFDLSSNEYSIADGTSVELTLSIYLTTSVVDEEVLAFEIPVTHGFQANVAGSVFVTDLVAAVTSNDQTIDVDATTLNITAPTAAGVNTDFTVSYEAVDANGNIDLANRTMDISLASGTGTLSSITGLTQDVFDGTFTWTDLQYDVVEDITLLIDDQGSALEGTTGTISISGATDAPAQILITEVVVTPFGGEFIEIYNNTSSEIFLDNYYITDATFANGGVYYYNIVTGVDYGGGDFSDWHARFPSGSTIAAGEVQTIAINGSEEFFTSYGIEPTYELYEDGASADAIPDMLEAVAGSINNQGTLTDGDEFIVLYYWDGNTDLVVDIDYFHWGTSDEIVDKTGVSIDGPDADATTSTYLNDTPLANQISVGTTHASGNSWQRVNFDEGAEINSGGNGVDGNDETSEDLNNTFTESIADPGNVTLPGTPLISLTTSSFNGNFGFVPFGTDSEVRSYFVEGTDLTTDITVTPPVGFEVATTADFSSTVGTNASPLILTQSAGAVASTEIFVRFVPDAADGSTDSGDIVHTSTGASDRSVAVEGTEGAATITDIATARGLALDTEVTVQGIVTTPDFGFGNDQYFVQDATAGINIFNGADTGVNIGDEVEITGTIDAFGDQVQISAAIVTVLSTGNTLPEAQSITTTDLSVTSDLQGSRVIITGVSLVDETQWPTEAISSGSGVTVDATVDGTTFGIRIDRGESFYDGSAVPSQPFVLTGILARFETEVQIMPFEDGDIAEETAGPGITLDQAGFNGDFGAVQVNTSSSVSSYIVSASGLTEDLTLTVAGEFEVSLTEDFSASVGNASTPLPIGNTQGDVEPTLVYVRFAPTVVGAATGSITHSSAGVDSQVINLSGEGTEEEVTSVDPRVIKQGIKLFPNPVNNGNLTVELSEELGEVEVKLMTLTGSTLQSTTAIGTTILKVGGIKSGVYMLQLSNEDFTQNYRVILK